MTDNHLTVIKTNCECCEESTYHIPLHEMDVTFDYEEGFVIHLNKEELDQLKANIEEVCK